MLSLATTGAEAADKAQSLKCCAREFFSLRRSTQNETSGQVTMLPRRRAVRTIRLPRKRGTGIGSRSIPCNLRAMNVDKTRMGGLPC
jgi:hypothetical protein